MNHTIHVTQTDIDTGIRADSRSCAVALAMNRQLGGRWSVAPVYAHQPGSPCLAVELPVEASDFIRRYDCRLPVEPISFPVEVPA